MPKRTYLPTFSKEMHGLGKYAYEHKEALLKAIDDASKLSDEEKEIARKAIDDILTAHPVFKKIWLDYAGLWYKGDWTP